MATKSRRRLSDEKRAERRRQDRERVQRAAEELLCSEGWARWVKTRAMFRKYSPHQPVVGRGCDAWATRVAGFKAWLKLGYCVRRGEKAVIRIRMPLPPSKKQLEQWPAAGGRPG